MKGKMGKTKIKKIENKAARQVAFSKRRRGFFSKAEQLSNLCDAKVAIIIFSAAGRPYSYCTSSMKEMIVKYEASSKKSENQESELLNSQYAMLCEEVAKKSQELRQLKGEGLEGLEIGQLQSMEDKIEAALKNLRKRMEETYFKTEIKTLQQRQTKMAEQNDKLRQMNWMASERGKALDLPETLENGMQEDGQSISSDSSITLKLGLPSWDD